MPHTNPQKLQSQLNAGIQTDDWRKQKSVQTNPILGDSSTTYNFAEPKTKPNGHPKKPNFIEIRLRWKQSHLPVTPDYERLGSFRRAGLQKVNANGNCVICVAWIPVLTGMTKELVLLPPFEHVVRAGLLFDCPFQIGQHLGHLAHMLESAVFVLNYCNADRENRKLLDLALAVGSRDTPAIAILFFVPIRNHRVECLDNPPAGIVDQFFRDDKNEIIAGDMPHKPLAAQIEHDIAKDPRRQFDDLVPRGVTIVIIERFEIVQIGVSDREFLVARNLPLNLVFDHRRTGKACRRIHRQVATVPFYHPTHPHLDYFFQPLAVYEFLRPILIGGDNHRIIRFRMVENNRDNREKDIVFDRVNQFDFALKISPTTDRNRRDRIPSTDRNERIEIVEIMKRNSFPAKEFPQMKIEIDPSLSYGEVVNGRDGDISGA